MKIARVEAIPVRIPRDLQAATGTAGTPNQLTGDGDYRWSRDYPVLYSVHIETALVKITLNDGRVGWGEAQAPLAPEVACTIVDRLLRPAVEGAGFTGTRQEIDELWQCMYSTMRVRGQTGGFMLDAISGVDLALWDLAGKIHQAPVSSLLTARPRTFVPAYVSGLPGASVEEKREAARVHYRESFRTFKLYYESDWNALLAQIDALREEFAEGVRIAVDALWHLHPELAVEMARALDSRQVLWLECPLMPEDVRGHARLAASVRTPLALGESYRTRFELAPFLEGIAKFIQPDLGRSGITEGMRIAEAAQERNLPVVPHVSIALGPQIAAAVHFAAAAPACDLCEYNPRVLATANRFLREPLRMDSGRWVVPDSPGLGVDLDEAAVLRFRSDRAAR